MGQVAQRYREADQVERATQAVDAVTGAGQRRYFSVIDVQTTSKWESADIPANCAKAEPGERDAIARFKEGK